jgi:dual specificity phosphatase 12
MKWMEPFLESGQIAGKIACPNKKCGAKLGNYDWAGMCCGCKEWVTPVCLLLSSSSSLLARNFPPTHPAVIQGFCINRSKVDEVV